MGVHLSKDASLAPISLASTVIGFISFAFTIATFLRVFWENLMTIFIANEEAHDILSTLRQEIYEERLSLRALRRHQRARGSHSKDVFSGPELDDTTIRSMQDTCRHIWKRFKTIERPFLLNPGGSSNGRGREDGRHRRRRRSRADDSVSPYYKSGRGDYEKGYRSGDNNGEENEEDYNSQQYCTLTLQKRFMWLRYRGDASQLLQMVQRLQTRRIARQVGEIASVLHDYKDVFAEMRHGIAETEGRLNRVVGVRRVD